MSGDDLINTIKNWLKLLGYPKQNVSSDKVDEELKTLTPPEMRDIWRNICNHVVPTQRSRYIRKVLLLEELKKRELMKRNVILEDSVTCVSDLLHFEEFFEYQQQLRNRRLKINQKKTKLTELKDIIIELERKKTVLCECKEDRNNLFTMLQMKTSVYDKQVSEMKEMHDCLISAVGIWNSESSNRQSPSQQLIRELMYRVAEFGKQRFTLSELDLEVAQKKLQSTVYDLTINVIPAELQVCIIKMLDEAVNAIVKSSDHANNKSKNYKLNCDNEKEEDLTTMRKKYVQAYMEFRFTQDRLKNQRVTMNDKLKTFNEKFQNICTNENAKKDFEKYLDTEHSKHRMMIKYKFLSKVEKTIKNDKTHQYNVNIYDCTRCDEFFKDIFEYKHRMIGLGQEINNNLGHVSNNSIKVFKTLQNYCKNQVKCFVEIQNSADYKNYSLSLCDSLKNELNLLKDIQLRLFITNKKPDRPGILMEDMQMTNSLIFMKGILSNFYKSINIHDVCEGALDDKRRNLQNEEKEFALFLKQLWDKSKENIKIAENEAETCTKNIELWTNFSLNELIPKHVIVDNMTFTKWQEEFGTYINRASKILS